MKSVKWTLLAIVVAAFMSGCAMDRDQEPSGAAFEEVPAGMLPAWKLPGDYKVPGKADQYDDYRAAHPEWYAITVPPSKTGIRAFREWEPMKGVMLSYPGSQGTGVNGSMSDMVAQGYQYVHWYVVVDGGSAQTSFNSLLLGKGMSQTAIDDNVTFVSFDLDTIWTIDFGPFPILDTTGGVAFVDFRYYHQRVNDDAIPTRFGDWMGVTTYRAEMDWEGGNFQTDENGTCYFTQGTYWENPDKTAAEIHAIMADYLGCTTFIALEPLNDGTTHMDMFSKLVSKNHFVLGKCTTANCSSATVTTLNNDAAILDAAVLADGTKLTLHRIPMPYQKDGTWRTFTNSTMANNLNLWPVYSVSDAEESEALGVWQAAAPGWNHVGIGSDTIITMGGAMHCISRNLPTGSYTEWEPGGPEWICNLNDCGGAQGCGDLTFEGCCDGDIVRWCENNDAKAQSCASNPACGWDSQLNYYKCGTGGGSDPSGQFPKDCNPCVPACTDKECGDDGCGGSCGDCPANLMCVPETGECVGYCGNGVCGDSEPIWVCMEDCDNCPLDCGCPGDEVCEQGPDVPPGSLCGYECSCAPDCIPAGKECGDDGCGGSCGSCPAGEVCEDGLCKEEVCLPQCAGKECGSDGCGGSCGACPDDGNTCTLESCLAGQCLTTDLDGKACDDGDACTLTDLCVQGSCQGTNPVICLGAGPCHFAGVCDPSTGLCSQSPKPDGSPCDDASACTQTDECLSGVCVGGNPVVCQAQDVCHLAGTCNPSTGVCSKPTKADGTPCDDGDECTQTDACQSGACQGSNPVLCTPLDQCHQAGTCNPVTGVCSTPAKADGVPCSDGNACTLTDQCQAGSCVGSVPVDCPALGQCHDPGTCDTVTGLCSQPQKPDDTPCDDGNPQTMNDHCVNGMCVGEGCDCTGTGDCCDGCHPVNEGGACDDGNQCTQADSCVQGACLGTDPVICAALDQCHWPGSCDSQTGDCSHPERPDDTPCDDGLFCSTGDTCQQGSCASGVDRDCTAVADVCNNADCNEEYDTCWKVPKATGTPCGDQLSCHQGVITLTDTCLDGDCIEGGTQSCAPYTVCKSGTECGTACKDDDDCVAGFDCLQSACWSTGEPVPDEAEDVGPDGEETDAWAEETLAETGSQDVTTPPDKPFFWDGWAPVETSEPKPDTPLATDIPHFSKPGSDCSMGHSGSAADTHGLVALGFLLVLVFLVRRRSPGH